MLCTRRFPCLTCARSGSDPGTPDEVETAGRIDGYGITASNQERDTPDHRHAGQCDDKGRDLLISNEDALDGTNRHVEAKHLARLQRQRDANPAHGSDDNVCRCRSSAHARMGLRSWRSLFGSDQDGENGNRQCREPMVISFEHGLELADVVLGVDLSWQSVPLPGADME